MYLTQVCNEFPLSLKLLETSLLSLTPVFHFQVLFTVLPVVHVYAISTLASDAKRQQGISLYPCPVYKKPRRTDLTFIFSLLLRTFQSPDHWTLRGVALLCDCKWVEISFQVVAILVLQNMFVWGEAVDR